MEMSLTVTTAHIHTHMHTDTHVQICNFITSVLRRRRWEGNVSLSVFAAFLKFSPPSLSYFMPLSVREQEVGVWAL